MNLLIDLDKQNISKLALGSAQFGMSYGISNRVGQVGRTQVAEILNLAKQNGINTLDTAIVYGESESVLGSIGLDCWNVISKLPRIPNETADIKGWVIKSIEDSLSRLRKSSLYGLLLHFPDDLFGDKGFQLLSALKNLKSDGLVKKIGVSIYSPDQLSEIYKINKFDIVQSPLNLLDRRLVNSGWAEKLNKFKVEIHARSSFLQGLLLMPRESRPKKFSQWAEVWKVWDDWLCATGISPLAGCLHYCLSIREAHRIIIGLESANQLKEALEACISRIPELPVWAIDIPDRLLNPTLWSKD